MSLKIDVHKFNDQVKVILKKRGEEVQKKVVKQAANMLYQQVKDLAQQRLHNRKNFFLQNVKLQETKDGNYQIVLDEKAVWIDQGLNKRQLRLDQLKGKDKVVIPLSEGPLDAMGRKNSSNPRFRTMSKNQPFGMWQTKALKGVAIFKDSVKWLREQIRAGKVK